jgi:hypothetical protein
VAAIVDPCQLIKEVKTFFSKLRLNNHWRILSTLGGAKS